MPWGKRCKIGLPQIKLLIQVDPFNATVEHQEGKFIVDAIEVKFFDRPFKFRHLTVRVVSEVVAVKVGISFLVRQEVDGFTVLRVGIEVLSNGIGHLKQLISGSVQVVDEQVQIGSQISQFLNVLCFIE